jgi:hypothetical protein
MQSTLSVCAVHVMKQILYGSAFIEMNFQLLLLSVAIRKNCIIHKLVHTLGTKLHHA